MTNRILVVVGVILMSSSMAVSQSVQHDEVVAADQLWATAYQSCDTNTMDELLAEDLVFIHLNSAIDTKETFMAGVSSCGMEMAKAEQTSVRVYGSTAVVIGDLHFKAKGFGEGALRYSRVFVKQNGSWRLVNHQSTALPKS